MSAVDYRVEYAVSGRACCREIQSCGGGKIAKGALRVGSLIEWNGEQLSWQWHHWECITPAMIIDIMRTAAAKSKLDGLDRLRADDQQKVVTALQLGKVAQEDLSGSAGNAPMSRTAASGGGGAAPQIGGYRIEYITSGKARCNGPKPCNGTFIENGALCLAVQVTIDFSTNWHRKHWGCVTPRVIKNLKNAIAHPQDLDGYDALRAEDQAKVVSAWDAGYIADDVVTESLLEPGTGSADTVQTASVPGASVAAIEATGNDDKNLVESTATGDKDDDEKKDGAGSKKFKKNVAAEKQSAKNMVNKDEDDNDYLGELHGNSDGDGYNPQPGAKRKRQTRTSTKRKKPKVESDANDN